VAREAAAAMMGGRRRRLGEGGRVFSDKMSEREDRGP
jgi:hypothetical protein